MKRALFLFAGLATFVATVMALIGGNWLAAAWAGVSLLWMAATALTAANLRVEQAYRRTVEQAWIHYNRRGVGIVQHTKEQGR